MASRWRTESWYVSPYNWAPEAAGKLRRPASVEVLDVTLRDGEESAGVVLDTAAKLRIAKALDAVGVRRIEAGLTIAPDDPDALKALLDAGLRARISTICACQERESIDLALKCGVDAIALAIPCSDVLIEKGLRRSRDWVLETSLANVGYAKAHGLAVNYFPFDTFRADLGFLSTLVRMVVENAGADSVTLVDTYGVALPQAVAYLVRRMKSLVKVPLELHCHNDHGLALANSLAGYMAGADALHASVLGLGFRCGNPPLEELAMALRALYDVDLGYRYERLYGLCRLVARLAKTRISRLKPLAGEAAFASEIMQMHRSLRAHGEPAAYQPYKAEFVGRRFEAVLAKWSDQGAIEEKLEQLGLKANEEQKKRILQAVKELSLRKKGAVTDEEFKLIVSDACEGGSSRVQDLAA